jgi:hypothetical protein
MNDKRTGAGRRTSDDLSGVETAQDINIPADIESLLAKINSGDLTPGQLVRIKGACELELQKRGQPKKMNSFTEVATVLGGGAAAGLAVLAVAPASATVAAVAALAGGFATWFAAEKIDEQHSEKHTD